MIKEIFMHLSDYKALTFDVYGTLIDWESGMIAGLKPLTDQVDFTLSRDEILEAHAHYESATQRQTPAKIYSELLAVVYKRLAEEWAVSVTWKECMTYGGSVQNWPAFDDSVDALSYLRQHFKLVVLSNIDNTSFAHSNKKLKNPFHMVYTAEDVGSYKPSPRNFDYMLENLGRQGIEKHEILHTAESMFHDHAPANNFGLDNCWIYRRHNKTGFGATMNPGDMPTYKAVYNSMADLVIAHQKELQHKDAP
jgi:2-haloacid dehalogenase/putative hydrolase of the HAD superfamily